MVVGGGGGGGEDQGGGGKIMAQGVTPVLYKQFGTKSEKKKMVSV